MPGILEDMDAVKLRESALFVGIEVYLDTRIVLSRHIG